MRKSDNRIKRLVLRGVSLICLVIAGAVILGGCKSSLKPTEGVLYEVSVDRSHAVVIGYEGTAYDVVIADKYNGVPVKRIESLPGDGITSVKIPDSIVSIGNGAFSACPSLREIVIPDSVEKIADGAFKYCVELKSAVVGNGVTEMGEAVFAFCDKLERVTLGEGITSLSDDTFAWCGALESVTILGNVTNIGASVFYDCSSLKSFVIPDGVTGIGESAFEWCAGLESIVIPSSLMIVGECAFENCESLSKIYYKGTEEDWTAIGYGVLVSLGDGVKVVCNYKEE